MSDFRSWIFAVSLFLTSHAFAQNDKPFDNDDQEGSGEVEALYDKMDNDQTKKKTKPAEIEAKPKVENKEITTLSDLTDLAPFEDVAVIQRRFLPRTGRFEFSGNGMSSLNNPFFNNMGLNLRAAYFLTEKHGIEIQYSLFSNTRRSVTDNLEQKRQVQTTNLVTAKNFIGAAYKLTPVYGKITFMNQFIIPFDLFFTAGGGISQTQKKGEPTIHLGTGQAFALSKSVAVRWDLTWNFYQATADSLTGTGTTKTNHNDLFLSVGASFFIPEATYR